MKFKVRSHREPSEVMEFWLEEEEGEISLKCGVPDDSGGWFIATVKADGVLHLCDGIDEGIGLKLDEDDRIVVEKDI